MDQEKRRMVKIEQLNSLLDFMKEHPDLAKGLSRGRRGKLMTFKEWNLCAKRLNAMKQGAVKDGKGWSKYWCDWKYRARRHALELKAARESDKPPPDGLTPLSSIEENIMGIIGENTLDVVIKADPLGDEDTSENEPENNEHEDETPTSQYYATRSKKRKHRRNSSRETSYLDDHNAASSPPESKARLEGIHLEDEDEATQFLKLEKEKLENSRILHESVQTIASELTRLTDVMTQIKDVLVNRLNT